MTDNLKKAIELQFDKNLFPEEFVYGASLISAKRRLNVDSVILAQLLGNVDDRRHA